MMSSFACVAVRISSGYLRSSPEGAVLYATTALTECHAMGRGQRSSAAILAPAIAVALCLANAKVALAQDGAALPPIVVVDPTQKTQAHACKTLGSNPDRLKPWHWPEHPAAAGSCRDRSGCSDSGRSRAGPEDA